MEGDTVLIEAVRYGQLEAVRYLLSTYGININARNSGGATALLVAVQDGHVEIVRYLVGARAIIDYINETVDRTTPLIEAAWQGNLEVVCLLVDAAAIVDATDSRGTTALMIAAQEGEADIVEFLVGQHGWDHDAKDLEGFTALMEAARSGHLCRHHRAVQIGVTTDRTEDEQLDNC